MKFTHLHVHSHYSLLDGMIKIDNLLDQCKELGMDSIALTDHGTMYGAIEFYKKAKERGIKPIIGNEVYVALDSMLLRRPKIDDKRHHLVLLAKNATGYKNLIKLTTKSYLKGFYYKPRVDKELLRKHSKGLIALSACLEGEIPNLCISGKIEKAEKTALEYQDIFGKENFYLEIHDFPKLYKIKNYNPVPDMIKISKKHNIPLIATNDTHYLKPEDAEAQDILMCVQMNKDIKDPKRLSMIGEDFSLRSPEQMIKSFQANPEAITNTQKIADQCSLEIELGKIHLPHFKVPGNLTPDAYLKKLSYAGLNKRYSKITKKILDRLNYELEVIKQTGFAGYFLIVQDFVNWAKKKNIEVGPGRGSCAGSIVSYLTNITDIDPLKYNLLFERFLNPERVSMPDIDLDFADHRRDEVIKYVGKKYGKNHVAQIITFGTMAARAAIRDSGRALGLEYSFCDKTAKMIPMFTNLHDSLEKIPEFSKLYQTDKDGKKLIDIAQKLEGVCRHASTHACGVVITANPLNQSVPVQYASQKDQIIITQYEMHAVEDLGLLKMDFLGLKNLTVIEKAIEKIEKKFKVKIDFSKISLRDKKVFQLLQQAKTTGVFQLESAGMRRYLKQLKPTEFEDIIAMVSLYRPGPMDFIPSYIARKHGQEKIKYLHPKLEPILKNTYGIAVYQEQVLQMARDLAGYTLGEADVLRKAVGKKIKELLDAQKEKFVQGCIKNKIDKKIAEKLFAFIEPFARYGFNRAHASCYAMIGFRTAYLKAHYPAEFMSALLTADQENTDRVAIEVDECRAMGIKVLPPDINESEENFVVTNPKTIRFGLNAIKNVGHNIVSAIVYERQKNNKYKTLENLLQRVTHKDLNKKSLESLIKCGALSQFGERNRLLANLETILNFARSLQKSANSNQVSLFGASDIAAPQLRLEDTKPVPKRQQLIWEKELLGLYISANPLEGFRDYLSAHTISCKDLENSALNQPIRIGGIIHRAKKYITKTGKPMMFVEIEDLTGKSEVVVFPRTLEQNPNIWQEDKILMIAGKLNERNGARSFICESARELG